MKNRGWCLTAVAAFAGFAMVCCGTRVLAAEGREVPPERAERPEPRPNPMLQHQEQFLRQVGGQMERLEQRLNQIAERQEQFMRQVGSQMERRGQAMQAGRENMRQPMPPPEVRRPMFPDGALPAARHVKAIGDVVGLLVLVWIVCNILMAVWIFTDIRKRGEGSAIFVAMAVVAGIPAALIYSLTRIGEKKNPLP